MLKNRVIPVLYLMNGRIVRSETFSQFKVIGNPINQLERLSAWLADELVYIDITRSGDHDLMRDDHQIKSHSDTRSILGEISKRAFMPLTFGGRIGSMDEVDAFIRSGADKVVITSQAYRQPTLVRQVAKKYGSQAMIAGIDVKREAGGHAVYLDQGRTRVEASVVDYATHLENLGAGEILLNSIDRDGTANGYDLEIIARVVGSVRIPVIACGGVGHFTHFEAAIEQAGANAVAAGNIFHFTENAYRRAKRHLFEHGINVRYPYRVADQR